MRRLVVFVIAFLSIAAVAQQTANPVSDAVREMLGRRAKSTIAAFEEMPADKYDYKPTPEQMTFGYLGAHIVEANNSLCGSAGNVPQPKVELKGTEGKEKLVAAMQASFDFCKVALEKATDSKMSETFTGPDGKPLSRGWAFVVLAASWSDHYSAAAMYLRLNGLLPPTAKKDK